MQRRDQGQVRGPVRDEGGELSLPEVRALASDGAERQQPEGCAVARIQDVVARREGEGLGRGRRARRRQHLGKFSRRRRGRGRGGRLRLRLRVRPRCDDRIHVTSGPAFLFSAFTTSGTRERVPATRGRAPTCAGDHLRRARRRRERAEGDAHRHRRGVLTRQAGKSSVFSVSKTARRIVRWSIFAKRYARVWSLDSRRGVAVPCARARAVRTGGRHSVASCGVPELSRGLSIQPRASRGAFACRVSRAILSPDRSLSSHSPARAPVA